VLSKGCEEIKSFESSEIEIRAIVRLQLDCPRASPGQVWGIFSGPEPEPPGQVRPPAGPDPEPGWTQSCKSGPGSVQVRTWPDIIQDKNFIYMYIFTICKNMKEEKFLLVALKTEKTQQ
jgi:hypothetical protein